MSPHSLNSSPRRSRAKELATKSGRAPRSPRSSPARPPLRSSPRSSPVPATHHLRSLTRSLHTSPVRTPLSLYPDNSSQTSSRSRGSKGLQRDATFIRSHSVSDVCNTELNRGFSLTYKGSTSSVNSDLSSKMYPVSESKKGASVRRASVPLRQDTFITTRVVPASSARLKSSLFSSSIDKLTSSKTVCVYANTSEAWGESQQNHALNPKSDVSVRRKQSGRRSNSVQAAAACHNTYLSDSAQFNSSPSRAQAVTSHSVNNSASRTRMTGICRESRQRSFTSTSRNTEELHTNASKSSGNKATSSRARSSHSKSSRRQ